MQSNKGNVKLVTSLPPLLRTATPSPTGVLIAGNQHATCFFVAGAITDGTFTPKVQHKANADGSYADVDAADLDGTLAAMSANTIQRVGYKGTYPYVQCVITVTGSPGTGGNVAAFVALENAVRGPMS